MPTLNTLDWILIALPTFGLIKGFFSGQGALNRTAHSLWGLTKWTMLTLLLVWGLAAADEQFHLLGDMREQSLLFAPVYHAAITILTWIKAHIK